MATKRNNTSTKTRKSAKGSTQLTVEMMKTPLFWILLAVCLIFYLIMHNCSGKEDEKEQKIQETPTTITSIQEVAEWEFLTVQLEEVVDTTLKKTFSGTRSTRIYTGTARLGIDMKNVKENWLNCHGDTAKVQLPKITLLDKNIIDDTKTRVFYESGKVSATLKEGMYQNAKKRMKKDALTDENLVAAKENAESQFRSMFYALGYKVIDIEFEK